MTTTITRVIEFDAGHRVLGHEGKCKHLHGHRYRVELTVEAPKLDPLGRVIDFSCLKEIVGGWVDREWDHNMLLRSDDPLIESGLLTRAPYIFDSNPTAENMAQELFRIARSLLSSDLSVVRVRVYETPNCWADAVGT